MFKLMGKEIYAILGAQMILIWTYVDGHEPSVTVPPQGKVI